MDIFKKAQRKISQNSIIFAQTGKICTMSRQMALNASVLSEYACACARNCACKLALCKYLRQAYIENVAI